MKAFSRSDTIVRTFCDWLSLSKQVDLNRRGQFAWKTTPQAYLLQMGLFQNRGFRNSKGAWLPFRFPFMGQKRCDAEARVCRLELLKARVFADGQGWELLPGLVENST